MPVVKHLPWIFIYAILLHLVWGITLVLSPAPLNITAIASIVKLGIATASGASWLYFTVAFLATMGVIAPKPAGLFFLLPQQLVLASSAIGAIEAMVRGSFADGVLRPHEFLIADQAPAVIAAVLHTLALYTSFLRSNKNGS